MQENYILKYYIVVYIDLLNQSSMLKIIDEIPIDNENSKELFIPALKNTVGHVKDFFNTFNISMDDLIEELDLTEQRSKYIKRYSDSIILYLPLKTLSEIKHICMLLEALCEFLFCMLSMSVPCRGGVAIGRGVEIEVNNGEQQLYGPVLAKAVELEKNAQYPSIVISKEYIQKYIPSIFVDQYLYFDDDYFRVNFLASSVKANCNYLDSIQKLNIFIDESLEKYNSDQKLLQRYERLKKATELLIN
jgi:hypothetical protein